jgi:hypothetical protein
MTSPSCPGQDELARAGRARRLDEENVARRPASRPARVATPGTLGAHRDLVLEPLGAEDLADVVDIDRDLAVGPFGDAHRGRCEQVADLALEASRTPASRV